MPGQAKTTYFGPPVVRDRMRVSDIRRLPFFDF